MNSKVAKTINRYAALRKCSNRQTRKLKKMYTSESPEVRTRMLKDIESILKQEDGK